MFLSKNNKLKLSKKLKHALTKERKMTTLIKDFQFKIDRWKVKKVELNKL